MTRDLPKYVSAFTDRHGRQRLRFRRTSRQTYYFQDIPGSPHFKAEYEACLADTQPSREETEGVKARALNALLDAQIGAKVPSVVYVIGEAIGGPVKIGLASNLSLRLTALQVGNPRLLTVYAVRPGDRETERATHLALHRFRGQGEWFGRVEVFHYLQPPIWLTTPEWCLSNPAGNVDL